MNRRPFTAATLLATLALAALAPAPAAAAAKTSAAGTTATALPVMLADTQRSAKKHTTSFE